MPHWAGRGDHRMSTRLYTISPVHNKSGGCTKSLAKSQIAASPQTRRSPRRAAIDALSDAKRRREAGRARPPVHGEGRGTARGLLHASSSRVKRWPPCPPLTIAGDQERHLPSELRTVSWLSAKVRWETACSGALSGLAYALQPMTRAADNTPAQCGTNQLTGGVS